MEPNNFEKDFREKLNQREIEPSNKAWDRLDAMLSVAEEKKPAVRLRSLQTSKRKWLYIAASFIGFLLVATIFFNQKEIAVESPKNVVVEKKIKKGAVEKPILNNTDSVKTEIAVSENPSEETLNKEEKNTNQKNNTIVQKQSNQIAESSVIIKNNQENQSTNTNQTVIAENPKKENIDQLLETAENKVMAENSNKTKKAKVKINAADLLNQVDGELELSFREKIITKVNKNLHEVKVALSNRNQEEKK